MNAVAKLDLQVPWGKNKLGPVPQLIHSSVTVLGFNLGWHHCTICHCKLFYLDAEVRRYFRLLFNQILEAPRAWGHSLAWPLALRKLRHWM